MKPAPRAVALSAVLAVAPAFAGCLEREPWPAPDFDLVDVDGARHDLSSYRGRVLVVDLMATWCVPCVAEMEHLRKVRASYPEDRVAILSVGADPVSDTDAALAEFRRAHGGSWPFARDDEGLARKLGLTIFPKLVLVSPEGLVVYENQGETYPAAIAKVVRRYVPEETG